VGIFHFTSLLRQLKKGVKEKSRARVEEGVERCLRLNLPFSTFIFAGDGAYFDFILLLLIPCKSKGPEISSRARAVRVCAGGARGDVRVISRIRDPSFDCFLVWGEFSHSLIKNKFLLDLVSFRRVQVYLIDRVARARRKLRKVRNGQSLSLK